jgi:hypothetical protein
MKISFDFDSCLSESYIQVIAMSLINMNHDVWIITSRADYINNKDLYKTCINIGISKNQVIFTNGEHKTDYYKKGNFNLHFDDDWEEVMLINNIGGNAILVKPDFEEIFSEMQYRENNE